MCASIGASIVEHWDWGTLDILGKYEGREAIGAALFSPGSVLYAPCTGGSPFRGSTAWAVLRPVSEPAPSIRVLLLSLSPCLLVLLLLTVLLREGTETSDAARAVAVLEKLGAKIKRDDKLPGKPVVEVDLKGTNVADADLKELAPLRELRTLELGDTQVGGPGLSDLAPLVRLETLRLERTPLTDEGLHGLAALTQVRSLSLEGTGITDAGLKHVAALVRLQALNLGGTKITDAGLRELTPLKQLGWLALYQTAVTDAGVKELAKLKSLSELSFNGTEITDEGLKELRQLKNLRRIDAHDTRVTDAGIKDLKSVLPPVAVNVKPGEAGGRTGSKAWLAALILGLGITLALVLGTWLYLRRGRAGRRAARAPFPVEPAESRAVRRSPQLPWLAALGLIAAVGLIVGLVVFGWPGAGDGTNQQGQESREPDGAVRRLSGHTGPVNVLRYTPDGRLISGGGWPDGDRSLRIWDPATGQELFRLAAPGQVSSLDLTPDGHFALIGQGTASVLSFDLESRQVIQELKGHGGAGVAWVAFAADGQHAFTASHDGTARYWDLNDGKEVRRFRVQGKWANYGAVSPDGRRLLTADNEDLLQLWDIATGVEIKRIKTDTWICWLTFLPDGRQALVGGSLWDLETGAKVRVFLGHEDEVHQAVLSADGRQLLSASFDGTVRLWDFQTGELLRVLGRHDEWVFGAVFSPDGQQVASGGGGRREGNHFVRGTDHDIRLWDLTTLPAATETPLGSRGIAWPATAAVLCLLLALSLFGVWRCVRRNHRPAKASPPPLGGPRGHA